MEEALELARAKDTKERMAAVERLYQLLEGSRKSLSSSEVTPLVDCCLDLLKDSNFRVSQGALQALASAAVLAGDHLKLHFNALVPAVVARLGDAKQPVRDAARRLLLTLMEVSSPTIIVERAGSYAWRHKSWRVREEFARTVTSAISLFASTELPLQRAILPSILQMLSDSNLGVREASILCIEEMYRQAGIQFRDELHRHQLPASMIKPAILNPKKSSPKAKSSSRETSHFGGENDITEKPIDPIKVYSDKELIREFEKISCNLLPEKDWSVRIASMQRVEGLVLGGAADYSCFWGLLKQLVSPLSTQLSDRRSSIVKQACHLLSFLSKELLGDFEACAEIFIPVSPFKLVVITVLVIAESADNCIKTMLRNCKGARVLPRIADCAKNDRSAVLRARCCEYALLTLEHWPDAPEIQRSADLYEELIRCCVADAMSEVRSTARMCYRMFAKTWPDRSRRLFSSFDPVIQRIINEEDGGMHRRHASPSRRERNVPSSFTIQNSSTSNIPGYGTSAIVAMDRTSSLPSGMSFSSGMNLSQSKPVGKAVDRTLESVLHSSKQKVSAIENMLIGLDISKKQRSTSLDLGIDPPSSRDPPFPAVVPASNSLTGSLGLDSSTSSVGKGSNRNGGLIMSDIILKFKLPKIRASYHIEVVRQLSLYQLLIYFTKRISERQERDASSRDSQHSYIPNFQRPLLRKHVAGRMSAGRRKSFDDSQLSLGERSNYVEGPASLSDALSEGLSPNSDWSARVAAFTCLRSLLQQGPKGIQEVIQNFEKVMKLFFQHLDDPHHKVAQAALSTLADIIQSCRRPFECYMERILPHVFSRLIDPKELVRQPSSMTLEIVSKTYSIDSLLPALLRSLDEQRSPKAKLAVIEFSISSFNKHAMNSEGSSNIGILKLWLSKLTPLVHDKNTKLKDAAITCIISVYTRFDPTTVLNFILSLSVEEQNSLRRALKQYTPRIEVDLVNFLQSKKERRTKSSYDPSDVGTSSEEGYIGVSKKSLPWRYSSGSVDSEGGRKWGSTQESTLVTGSIGQATSDETQENIYQNLEISPNPDVLPSKTKDLSYMAYSMGLNPTDLVENLESNFNLEGVSAPQLETNVLSRSDSLGATYGVAHNNETSSVLDLNHLKPAPVKIITTPDVGPSIPQILHMICNENDESPTASKRSALEQLIEFSVADDPSIWNKILTAVLEVLDDSDSAIRELALSLIVEMLKNQKDAMEDSVEIVIEKLLHVTKDIVPKVSNEAEHCLNTVLSQYDPFRCLSVIVPLLVTEDEKTLVICINCLTKLVGRLSHEELMAQLPSFLPALFEAFGNQSADIRKTVVFCLVDIYIMLGKAFLPHLEGLNSTQLRLVTIYANRISQARTGTPIDANHD
ncbi:CLIP-associated protein [Hibiscus syriacus]|uniref:CLIP-associated protein n=1 Tax=Hibiscus syriacus TaxID=106335 RepID=A0A6A2Z0B4_HIBSY|nr:CLIP-associated protein [Hibiscus syriacus]